MKKSIRPSEIRLSENEMVAHLKRTRLPTILVEGSDESLVYRYLEDRINVENIENANILICHGRNMLINVFKRREEFPRAKVVFVADQDMWFFEGIPKEYKNKIVFTEGYSLENDLYIQTFFEKLLDNSELESFQNLIKELSVWFAFEVDRYNKTGNFFCDVHINEICPKNVLSERFKQKIQFVDPPILLIQRISQDYTKALRGKNLFEALLRFLSYSKRPSKYSRDNLIELGTKNENPRLTLLVNSILDKFRAYSEPEVKSNPEVKTTTDSSE